MVLETPKLVRLLFMATTISVPNFIIFPCSVHRAAIDSHWTRIIIIIIIIIKHTIAIGALALWAWPLIIIIIIKHTIAIGATALWAWPLNIAASSDYRCQARKRPIGRRRVGKAKRQKQNIHGKNR